MHTMLTEPWKKAWVHVGKGRNVPELFEMDFLGHTATAPHPDLQFGERITRISPSSSASTPSSSASASLSSASDRVDISPGKSKLADHLADTDTDPLPAFYVPFEIMSGKSKNAITEKLLQLERDISFLVARHRTKSVSSKARTATARDIVSYAGIATLQDAGVERIIEVLNSKVTCFPMLCELRDSGQLLTFIGVPSLFEFVSESGDGSLHSREIKKEKLKREQYLSQEAACSALLTKLKLARSVGDSDGVKRLMQISKSAYLSGYGGGEAETQTVIDAESSSSSSSSSSSLSCQDSPDMQQAMINEARTSDEHENPKEKMRTDQEL
jgi:hypothetical protein